MSSSAPDPPALPPDPDSDAPSGWRRAGTWIERTLTVAVLAFVAVRLGPQAGAWLGVEAADARAPTFTAVTLDGDTLSSADLRGRVVVVNFWATWCAPCRLEMPALQRLHRTFADEDVAVVGLSVDAGDTRGVRAWAEEREITFPVALATWEHRRAFGGIPGVPTTFVIGRDGVVRHRVVGFFAPPALRASVRRLLEEPGSASVAQSMLLSGMPERPDAALRNDEQRSGISHDRTVEQ